MQGAEKDCVFCKIVAGEIPDYRVWENEHFIAFLDLRPIHDGHTLIVPKSHTDYVFDLQDEMYTGLFLAGKILAPHIQQVTSAKRIGLVVEGFGVPHTHLHLVPLFGSNELDPHKAHVVSKESLIEMQERIKKLLA